MTTSSQFEGSISQQPVRVVNSHRDCRKPTKDTPPDIALALSAASSDAARSQGEEIARLRLAADKLSRDGIHSGNGEKIGESGTWVCVSHETRMVRRELGLILL